MMNGRNAKKKLVLFLPLQACFKEQKEKERVEWSMIQRSVVINEGRVRGKGHKWGG